jgi:ribosome-associated protein
MAKIKTPQNSKALATFCAKIAAEKIASDIIVMDLENYETSPADFFVICSSDSENQSRAIADFIMRESKNASIPKPKIEGDISGDWILIDYFDVVLHVMLRQVRSYYKIENLWKDATFHKFNSETSKLNKATFEEIEAIFNDKMLKNNDFEGEI